MFQIVLTTDVALGNGTRRRGEVLATLTGSPEEWAKRIADGTAEKHLTKAKLGDGVNVAEVITALRNSQHCEFVDPKTQEAAKSTEDAGKEQ